MNEKYKGIRKRGKVVRLLLGASLIVMLTMSLMFTSVTNVAGAGCTVPESAYDCKCPEGSNEGKKHKSGYVKTPNGCSIPFEPSWKDNPVGEPGCSFKDACDAHDCCYGTCNSNKATCDNAFREDMMQICNSSCPYVACKYWANIYYWGVVALGCTHYSNNQNDACEKCCCNGYQDCDGDGSCECLGECCGAGTPNAGACYDPSNPEDGCCAHDEGCYDGTHPPDKCTTCYSGSWNKGWECEGGECVPEASTFVLLGFGLLCVGGYFRLKRKEN